MQNTKFTKDGKKVVVVSAVNNSQYIVQEVYCSGKIELPAGENFVVSEIFDTPVLSWKEKKIKEVESQYKDKVLYYKNKRETLEERENILIDSSESKLKAIKNTVDNICGGVLDVVTNLLTNKYKFVVFGGYDCTIEEFVFGDVINNVERRYNTKKFDSLKLLTLFGCTNGDLQFRINRYSDGSGHNEDVYFFETIEEAKGKLKELYEDSEKYSSFAIKNFNKFNIPFNLEKLNTYNVEVDNKRSKRLVELKKELEDKKKEIEELNLIMETR